MVLTANHCPETDVSTDTIPRFVNIDFFEHAIFINADVLSLLPGPYALPARFSLAASIADCGAAVRAV